MDTEIDNHSYPSEDHVKVLNDKFKIDNFKEDQWKAISQLMYKKEDVFICATSGYGKSLIYQFPPVFLGKKAFIISPLISLMETQVQKLKSLGIAACCISGQHKNYEMRLENYSIIYSTLENFLGLREIIKWGADNDEICLIAIDESHCISKLSSENRPAYANLKFNKKIFPSIPIVALTSTASKDTTADICKVLELKNPLMIKIPLNRPNIEYICIPKSHCFISDVKKYLLDLPSGSGVIVYCFKKLDTDYIAELLTREGFNAKPYNSGLQEEIRRETLSNFMNGTLNFIVTTNACGMGIDRADVRVVINYGLPKSPETYYMESGRAGRDDRPAKSIILWSNKDIKFHIYCFKENSKKNPLSRQSFNNSQILLNKMQEYSVISKCRRLTLLNYLEESIPSINTESCCDNCLEILHQKVGLSKMYKEITTDGKIDITDDIRMILNIINAYQGMCKHDMIVSFITGIMPTEFDPKHPIEYFARGSSKSQNWWTCILKVLSSKGFIERFSVVQTADNIIGLWGAIARDDYVRATSKGIKFVRLKTKKLMSEPKSDFLQTLTKSDTEYYIVNGEVHEKPRVNADELKAFDLSALSSDLNKSSPRKRLASDSDTADMSLMDVFKSPLKDELDVEKCSKLLKISELCDNQPCCSHWNNKSMQMNGDKEQNEGQSCDEPKNVDINEN